MALQISKVLRTKVCLTNSQTPLDLYKLSIRLLMESSVVTLVSASPWSVFTKFVEVHFPK